MLIIGLNVIDKGISVFIASLIYSTLPKDVRFKIWDDGWKQTPLTRKEVRDINTRYKNGFNSLRTRVIILLFSAILAVAIIFAWVSSSMNYNINIDKGNEVLFLIDYLDEFTLKAMGKYNDHEFINVLDEKTNSEETEEVKKINDNNKDLIGLMKETLNISNVKFSDKLKNHPVALVTEGEVSLEMEKAFKAMPNGDMIKANKVLEINTNHEVYNKLISLYESKKEDEVKDYTKVLYNMARLINGLSVDDPNELTNIVCELISK